MTRALLLLALAACSAPELDTFTDVDAHVTLSAEEANGFFVATAQEAERELRVALPGLTDPALTDALIEAYDRGVDVMVVTDIDRADDEGVARLLEANVPTTLANDGITYFEFNLNEDVVWESEQTQMTHAFAVADMTRITLASEAGFDVDAPRFLLDGVSEDMGQDLVAEHIQVFGGSDAVSKTAFDALAKSITDARWIYPTQSDEMVELWFGPQERILKRAIDAVYYARASIRVMTEDFADEGLARALQQKAEDGFDVEVIVGNSFGSTNPGVSEVLLSQAPDVPVLQSSSLGGIPTILFIDFDRSPHDGNFHMPMGMVLTHPIWSASRLYNEEEVVTDQLCDGTLTVLSVNGEPTKPLQDLANLYRDERTLALELR
jgi:hypothetical protein